MSEGYIKLFRKILDNHVIMSDSDHLTLFIYLLLNAAHEETKVMFCDEEIILKRGELVTGRKNIADKLKINESKIQRMLDKFAKYEIIEQLKTNKGRLIIIKNWCRYQISEQQMNSKRTANEQQVNTNKNIIDERNSNIKENTNNNRIVEKEEIYKEEKEKIDVFDYDWMDDEHES